MKKENLNKRRQSNNAKHTVLDFIKNVFTPNKSHTVLPKDSTKPKKEYFFSFARSIISSKMELGKIRTAETYTASLNSFKRFRKNKDILLNNINSDVITAYEYYLTNNGVCPNTSSFYMRNLRAIYNQAVEKELTTQKFPFKHVYTGVEKTTKRAIPMKTIKQIKEIDLTMNPALDYARDMFMFSFYTRGMSFVDMAYLRQKDLNGEILSYRRRKTGQRLYIKWEKCMDEIVNKYKNPNNFYLLPIIDPKSDTDKRKQYLQMAQYVNRNLKAIGKILDLDIPLTMYVSRHSWASIAKSKKIPLSVISEGMGHDSERTTQIYLTSLDSIELDKANRTILNSL